MTTILPFTANRTMRQGGVKWAVALSIVLLAWPNIADALSLGRSRGAAVLGRPLDVSVLAGLEPQETAPDAACFNAEVFYGDTKISPQNVTVTPLRTSPSELTLRVRSSAVIDEAFVTVYMRATCGQNISKRFVLLSDSPTEQASSANVSNLPLLGAPTATPLSTPRAETRSSTARTAPSAADAQAAKAERAQKREAARQLRAEQKQSVPVKSPVAKADIPEAAVAASRKGMSPSLGSSTPKTAGRLKVDLLEFEPGREPSLRSSAELLSQPTADMQARAQAAAMWRAINASPEDLLRDAQRLKTIEADVLAMSQLTKQQTQELTAIKTDLAQAQRSRYANPLVYALGGLTLASLAFAAWAWRRSSRVGSQASGHWWGSAHNSSLDDSRSGLSKMGGSELNSAEGGSSVEVGKRRSQDRERDFVAASKLVAPNSDLAGLTDIPISAPMALNTLGRTNIPNSVQTSTFNRPEIARGAVSATLQQPDFGHSSIAGLRPVNAEELFDIQQQADFFMSLGQHTQAIDILQNHISDNVETSALAYLDLFDIYHKVGMQDEFVALRDEFNRVFNAQVPEYASYGSKSRGLEEYQSAVERIQALWPNPKVLEIIEESIFRKPDRDNEPFDLLAYRELMLLYAVAKDISENESVMGDLNVDFDTSLPPELSEGEMAEIESAWGSPTEGFAGTQVQPLSTSTQAKSVKPVIADLDDTVKNARPDDWEEALSKLPLASKAPNLDIDVELFAQSQPAALTPSAAKPAPSEEAAKDGNGINFELIPKRNFSQSKQGKLDKS